MLEGLQSPRLQQDMSRQTLMEHFRAYCPPMNVLDAVIIDHRLQPRMQISESLKHTLPPAMFLRLQARDVRIR